MMNKKGFLISLIVCFSFLFTDSQCSYFDDQASLNFDELSIFDETESEEDVIKPSAELLPEAYITNSSVERFQTVRDAVVQVDMGPSGEKRGCYKKIKGENEFSGLARQWKRAFLEKHPDKIDLAYSEYNKIYYRVGLLYKDGLSLQKKAEHREKLTAVQQALQTMLEESSYTELFPEEYIIKPSAEPFKIVKDAAVQVNRSLAGQKRGLYNKIKGENEFSGLALEWQKKFLKKYPAKKDLASLVYNKIDYRVRLLLKDGLSLKEEAEHRQALTTVQNHLQEMLDGTSSSKRQRGKQEMSEGSLSYKRQRRENK